MKVRVGASRGAKVGLCLTVLLGTGCGVVYTPQEFEKSSLTYGYKGDLDVAIEVIPLTFMAARAANSDGYAPRRLPGAFSDPAPVADISTRSRLQEAGVYEAGPPLVLDLPPAFVPYDGSREVIPPALRNEQVQPAAIPEPLYLPLPAYEPVPSYEGSSSVVPLSTGIDPRYVSGSLATPLAVDGRTPGVLAVRGASSASAPQQRQGRQASPFASDVDLEILLERPQLRRPTVNKPLPYSEPLPYRIGPGDVIGLQIRSNVLPSLNDENGGGLPAEQMGQRLLVQDNGEIFVPQVGSIAVNDLTLDQARRVINDRLVANGLGFDPSVQIVDFGSKSISISGLNGAQLIPVSVRPTTLGEAVVAVGGLGAKPENAVVRVLRDGEIYEMSGDQILASGELAQRILIDGDLVAVTSGYDSESAMAYFDQQIRLREIDRNNFLAGIAASQEERAGTAELRAEAAERRAEQAEIRAERAELRADREDARAQQGERRAEQGERRADRAEQRADQGERRADTTVALDETRLELDLRRDRLEADRLRREAEILRLQSQRETDRFNEEARIANIEARQSIRPVRARMNYPMTPEDALQKVRERFPFERYMTRDPAPWLTVARIVNKYLKPGDRLFDLGSGACDKTAIAQVMGIQCTAVDDLQDGWHLRDDNAAQIMTFAESMGIDFHRTMPPPSPDTFDMVMMNDVIEHLVDSPRDLLIDLVERLKPGGYLFITVPNLANIRKRLDLMRGRTNLPEFDLYYWYEGAWRGPKREYVRNDLESLCRNLSLEVVELDSVHHMLTKLPKAVHPVYKGITSVFTGWRDTWLLVARKPEGWQPQRHISETEFATIYNRTNVSGMHDQS